MHSSEASSSDASSSDEFVPVSYPVIQFGGGSKRKASGAVEEGKEDRMTDITDNIKSFIARTTGMGAYAECIQEFMDMLETLGRTSENHPETVLTDLITPLSDADLDELLRINKGKSNKVEAWVEKVGRIVFKDYLKEIKETDKQIKGCYEMVGAGAELALVAQLADKSSGRISWETFTDLITKQIRKKAACHRRHAETDEDAPMEEPTAEENDDGDDDAPPDGKKRRGRPPKKVNTT